MLDIKAFREEVEDELKKESNAGVDFVKRHGTALGHAAEIGGLGILAKPSVDAMRKPKKSANEEQTKKRHAKYELAGLGVLAAPSAIHMAHSAWKKFHP